MKITEVNIVPIKPNNGLIGFASVIVDGNLYLSSIAIYVKLDGNYRLLYPDKRVGERMMGIFYPINRETSKQIEDVVFARCNEIFQGCNDDRYDKTNHATRS